MHLPSAKSQIERTSIHVERLLMRSLGVVPTKLHVVFSQVAREFYSTIEGPSSLPGKVYMNTPVNRSLESKSLTTVAPQPVSAAPVKRTVSFPAVFSNVSTISRLHPPSSESQGNIYIYQTEA